MSAPVTRGELQEELKKFSRELRAEMATKAELAKAIEPLATRVELEIWGGALLARMDRMYEQLQIDLARHVSAFHESMMTLMRGLDEKYTDLPGRVDRLESAVFAPKPR